MANFLLVCALLAICSVSVSGNAVGSRKVPMVLPCHCMPNVWISGVHHNEMRVFFGEHTNVTDYKECDQLCFAESTCAYFTYNLESKSCQMIHQMFGEPKEETGDQLNIWISGKAGCSRRGKMAGPTKKPVEEITAKPDAFTCKQDGEGGCREWESEPKRIGGDRKPSSQLACEELCRQTSECHDYNFQPSGKICRLFKAGCTTIESRPVRQFYRCTRAEAGAERSWYNCDRKGAFRCRDDASCQDRGVLCEPNEGMCKRCGEDNHQCTPVESKQIYCGGNPKLDKEYVRETTLA